MEDEYNIDVQNLFLYFLISDSDLWIRTNSILQPEYFHRSLQKVVKYIQDHTRDYNGIPTIEQVKASTGVQLQKIPEIDDAQREWFLQNIEQFCRHRALELWLIKGMDYVQQGKYGQLEQGLKDSLLISLHKNLGINYFDNPKERLMKIKDNNGQVSTGWRDLDKLLYGGFNRGELNIFAAGSGGGKSLFLQNLAVNKAVNDKMNVVYITLELSEELISMRLDSMISGVSSKDIFKQIDIVHDTVSAKRRSSGIIQVKYMKSGTTVNEIKSYLKEFEIQEGVRPDVLIVDYLDLLFPNDKRISPSDMFIKDKYVSEELRALSIEMYPNHRLLMATASQLNRGAVEEVDYTHANIAGGISKINTADNLIAIYTSNVMRQRNRYQLQLLKTRNSAGTGEKIDLKFDSSTLRVLDLDEDDLDQDVDLLDKLKKNSVERVEMPSTKSSASNVTASDILSIVKGLNK